MMSEQVLAGRMDTQRCLIENNLWEMTQSRVTKPHASPGFIQFLLCLWKVQRKAMRNEKKMKQKLRMVPEQRHPGQQTGTWAASQEPKLQWRLCVLLCESSQIGHGSRYCVHNKQGHVQFNFFITKDAVTFNTSNGRKSLRFFFFFNTKQHCPNCQAHYWGDNN